MKSEQRRSSLVEALRATPARHDVTLTRRTRFQSDLTAAEAFQGGTTSSPAGSFIVPLGVAAASGASGRRRVSGLVCATGLRCALANQRFRKRIVRDFNLHTRMVSFRGGPG